MKKARAGLAVLALLAAGCFSPLHGEVEEQFNFWPIARYDVGIDPPGYTLDLLWPLSHFHRVGDARQSWIVPLYFTTDDGEGESFTDVLLLGWRWRDELADETRFGLFPVLWAVRSPTRDGTWVWPLYGSHRGGTGDDASSGGFVLWPLATWSRGDGGATASTGVLDVGPVLKGFAHLRTPDEERTDVLAIADVPFDGWDPEEDWTPVRSVRVLPFLDGLFEGWTSEHATHGDETRDATRVLSLSERYSLAGGETVRGAGGEVIRREHHAYPLWVWEKGAGGYERRWILPPLYGHEVDPAQAMEATDVLWPLGRHEVHGGDDPRWHLRALPFVWFTKRPDSEVSVVVPFWYRVRDAHDDYLHVVPFYGRHVLDDGALRRSFVVPPLYVHTTDARTGLDRTDAPWPLARFETSDTGSLRYVVPLFYARRDGEASHTNVLLLFDRRRSEQASSTLLYPLLGRASTADGGSSTSVLPLLDLRYWIGAEPRGEQLSVLFPFAHFARDGDVTRRWVFPFFWWLDGPDSSHHHVWPLFGIDRGPGGFTRWSALFPLFFRGTSPDGERSELGVLFPLGAALRDAERDRSWLFPLWYHSVARAGDDSLTWVLWPLFARHVRADGSRLTHSLGWLVRDERGPGPDAPEEFWLLGGLYHSRRDAHRSSHSVAFLYGYEDDGETRTLKLFHLIPIEL